MPKVIHHALTAVGAKSLVEKGALEPPGARAVRAGTFVLGLPSAASAIGSAGREFYCPLRRGSAGGRGRRAHSLEAWIDVETESPLSGMRASLATILAIAEMNTADEPPAGRET